MSNENRGSDAIIADLFVPRPSAHLASLPLEYRWETTRRHPYYLCFWETARRYCDGAYDNDRRHRLLGMAANRILALIGVQGSPPDPAFSFADLGQQQLHPAWLSGAVQPVSLRTMANLLIGLLPRADRLFLARLFALTASSSEPENNLETDQARILVATIELSRHESEKMDSILDFPIYRLDMEASQRTLVADVQALERYWKNRKGTVKQRARPDKYPEYLQIWDLREGWTGNGYDRSREITYPEIQRRLKLPLSTVSNGYQAAFELIIGRSFSVELWERLIGVLKFNKVFGSPDAIFLGCYRRLTHYASRRPVPESVVNPVPSSEGTVRGVMELAQDQSDDIAEVDLRIDLMASIAQGRSEEMAQQLGINSIELQALRQAIDARRSS